MDLTQVFGNSGNAVSANYGATQVAFNIFFSFILSSLVAFVYQLTHKGYSYSKTFVTSLVLISLVVSVIMMVIGNSLARAFALLGSFSIIRFRTAVKDTKDIAFVFLALVVGMAIGTNNYTIGLIGTVLILIVVMILDRFNLVGAEKSEYTLSVFTKGSKSDIDWKKLDNYVRSKRLLSISSRDSGKISEHLYAVDFKKNVDVDKFVKQISSFANIDKINIFSAKEELEY